MKMKKNAGITMISLAVTIIVLIILAGVSISMIIGDNGIITQAQRAAKETANATIASEEQMNALIDELHRYSEDDESSGSLAELVTSTNYGDYIDYPIDINNDGNTTNDWRIFYNDGEHVFIIAADYVPNTSRYLDNAGTGMDIDSIYNLYWATPGPTTTQTVTDNILNLFRQSWTDYNTNVSGRCISSLLNINNWDGFVNNNYARYAIGGPTIEMWVESWNVRGYKKSYCDNTNRNGYYVGDIKTSETTNYDLSSDSGYKDTLYFPHQSGISNCYGYWVASPSACDMLSLVRINCNGYVDYNHCDNLNLGVRPLVCLNSSISATKDEENIWRF